MTPEEKFLVGYDKARAPKDDDAEDGEKRKSCVLLPAVSEEKRLLFQSGLQRMAMPDVPFLPVPTTPRSPWYRRRCAECRHTFRVGDLAASCPRCQRVYHWNPLHGLDCLGVVFDNEDGHCICHEERVLGLPPVSDLQASPDQVQAFVNGLSHEWSAYGGRTPIGVTPELEGRLCAVCGHTVRLREMIVLCPCGNGPGNKCPAVIHQDFARQLYCWNEWNDGRGKSYCALTGHKIRDAEENT